MVFFLALAGTGLLVGSTAVLSCGRDAPFGIQTTCYLYPEQVLQRPWLECKQALEQGLIPGLNSGLNSLYEARLDTGFSNAPDYATLLIREAYPLLYAKNFPACRLLGRSAYDLAPDFFPASLFLSKLALADPEGGPGESLRWRWVSLQQRARHFLWQYRFVGKVLLLLLFSCVFFFLFLGPYFLIRYGRLLLHALQDCGRMGLPGKLQVGLALLLSILAVLFLPGFLWLVVVIGFVMGRFARKWERALFGSFLLLGVLFPFLVLQAAGFLSPLPDASRAIYGCIQGSWNAAYDRSLDRAIEKHPDSVDLILTRALVEKRRGEYETASRVLQDALKIHPGDGRLMNNLGSVRALQGAIPEAMEAFSQAIRLDESLAAPHYNLSQLLRRGFSFIEGGREFAKARSLDPRRVDYLAYIHSLNANRFFMDEGPSKGACWRFSMEKDAQREQSADSLWLLLGSGIPLGWVAWTFVSLAAAYLLLRTRWRRIQGPGYCRGCGGILCPTCGSGAVESEICTQCHQALYEREGIPREKRRLQIRKMFASRDRRFRKAAILNLFLPGVGLSVYGERIYGMLCLFFAVFLAVAALLWNALLPLPIAVWETGSSASPYVFASCLILLYGSVQFWFFRRIRHRGESS